MPPNIVLIMTDQQRADFMAADGFPLDTMPFTDGLGRQGTRFARAYTPNPTCGPARCSMLTGRFPKATGVRENGGLGNIRRTPDLVDVLRGAGYTVHLAGKNHTYRGLTDFDSAADYHHTGGDRDAPRTQQEAAFDGWLGALDHGVSKAPTPFPVECQLPWRIVRDALDAVDARDASRPFFLWLSFPEPHNPYQVPEPYFSMFPEDRVPPPRASAADGAAKGPKWRWMQRLIASKRPNYLRETQRYRANYCGVLRLIDDQARRFVAGLAVRGLGEQTLLVFCSDHGDYAGDYGLQRKGVGLPECLVRVPLLFHGPGVKPAPTMRPEHVSLVDLLPTVCDMLGVETPYGVQGRSLWPILRGDDPPPGAFDSIYAEVGFGGEHYGEHDRPPLHFGYDGPSFDELNRVTQSGKLKMVRRGDWKLTFDHEGHGELYHLPTDPCELRNRWDDATCRDARLAMTECLLQWTIRTEDDLPLGRYVPNRHGSEAHNP